MVNNDVYQIATDYIGRRSAHILGLIEGKPESNYQIDEHNLKILKRGVVSSVFSLELKYLDQEKNGAGQKRILIKYFGRQNGDERKAGYKDFAESTINTCNFLSGNGDFPIFYFSEKDDAGVFLGLEQIGDKTVHDASREYNPEEIRYLVQSILPHMARFQINASMNLEKAVKSGKMTKEQYESIFRKRPSRDRILDYLRAIKGKGHVNELNKSLRKKIVTLSVPIRRTYEPRRDTFRVTHGDPIFKNIIQLHEGKNRYGFIDAEPTLGDKLLDLAALLATPNLNLNPSDWYFLTDVFLSNDKRELEESEVDIHSIRSKLVSKLESFGVKFSDDELPGNHYFYLISGLFSRCSRISAKVNDLKKHYPDKYERIAMEDLGLATTPEDMKRIMSLSLFEVINDPNKFQISRDEYVESLKEFHEVLGNEGIINSPNVYLENNKNRQNASKKPRNQPKNFDKRTHPDRGKRRVKKIRKT